MNDCSIAELISNYVEEVRTTLTKLPMDKIEQIIKILQDARLSKRRIYIFGNGGSAAIASHFASDLNKGAIADKQPRFKAFALTDNFPVISAWANDTSYSNIFVQQLENHLEPKDVVIGISASGSSENVTKAMEFANHKGATTLAFTGFDGGKIKDIAQFCIVVPNNSMEQVEDIHALLEHVITICLRGAGGI